MPKDGREVLGARGRSLVRQERGLFEVEPFRLEKAHVEFLTHMGAQEAPQLSSIVSEFRAGLSDLVPPNVMTVLAQQLAAGYLKRLADALRAGDMEAYIDAWGGFAKGFAEAGIPFRQLDEVLRFWEVTIFGFILRTYRTTGQLQLAMEARQRLAHIYTTVAARAYNEVHDVTLAHLRCDLGEALNRPDAIWYSMLTADRIMGLETFHPRVVAQCMLDLVEYPGTLEERGGKYIHKGPHVMVSDCRGEVGSCLSGFLAEAKVERLRKEAVRLESIRLLPDNLCEVTLIPILPDDHAGGH